MKLRKNQKIVGFLLLVLTTLVSTKAYSVQTENLSPTSSLKWMALTVASRGELDVATGDTVSRWPVGLELGMRPWEEISLGTQLATFSQDTKEGSLRVSRVHSEYLLFGRWYPLSIEDRDWTPYLTTLIGFAIESVSTEIGSLRATDRSGLQTVVAMGVGTFGTFGEKIKVGVEGRLIRNGDLDPLPRTEISTRFGFTF